MKKLGRFISAAALVAATAGSAQAATANFDFAKIADDFWALTDVIGTPYEGSYDQVKGSSIGSAFSSNGITLQNIVGSYTGGAAYGFFDHTDSSGTAGLGVCHSGFNTAGLSRCSTGVGPNNDDDNIATGEAVQLVFNQAISFTSLLFKNVTHKLANGSIIINGVTYTLTNGVLSAADIKALGTKSSFTFAYANGSGTSTELYLSAATVAAVPLPAGGALILSGLAALGLVSRKRRSRKAA